MKAYNPEHVRNRAVVQQAARWQREGLLHADQLEAIRQAYPVPFRDSNVFAEIGAFVFTAIAVGGAYALVLLIITGLVDDSVGFSMFNILVSAGLLGISYSLIRRSNFYRNGPDNALTVLAASFLLTAINIILPNEAAFWFRCLLAIPVLLLFAAYFGDVIVTFMAVVSFYAATFAGLLDVSWGITAIPFVLMGVSLGMKYLLTQTRKRLSDTNQIYYADAFSMAEWVSLIVLAAAGNYFVVRELNGLLMEVAPGQPRPLEAPPIRFAPLFWLLTFLIPGTYAYLGFTRKDRMYLILAILGIAAAASTLRNYYPILPLSLYMTLSGAALMGIAIAAIRSLRQPKFGFTDVPDEESPRQFFLNAETLSVISATGATMNRQPDMKFGDGDFGGGGAGNKY